MNDVQVITRYEPRGAAVDLLTARDSEVVASGPAGTGKTLAALWKAHITSMKVPRCTSLILRQTHASLTASTLATFENQVAGSALLDGTVKWFGGSGRKPPAYEYSNGSTIIVGGLDSPGKFLSMDVNRIYVDEASQISLTAFETLLTRLRGRADTYRQIVLMTNPDHPAHWINERAAEGKLRMIKSLHRDNPYLINRDGSPTDVGTDYLGRLDALTGVRRLRYRDGVWAAAEGQVFDEWTDAANLVDPHDIPADWRTVWSIDFGYSNPFVWQQWRIDHDGRAYLTHEISRTQRLVEDHARDILALMSANGWARPEAIICDHDAEGRATLERHLGMATLAARKNVTAGVQHVQNRIRPAGDGRPRLLVLRDSLMRTDPNAATDKRPRGFAAEVGGYVWAMERGTDGNPKEVPLKLHDHSMDAARYLVMYLDGVAPRRTHNPAKAQVGGATSSKWGTAVGR